MGGTWRHPPISNREKKAKTQKCFDAEHSSRCAVVDSSGSGLRGLWAVPRLSIDVGEIPRQIFSSEKFETSKKNTALETAGTTVHHRPVPAPPLIDRLFRCDCGWTAEPREVAGGAEKRKQGKNARTFPGWLAPARALFLFGSCSLFGARLGLLEWRSWLFVVVGVFDYLR